MNAIIDQGLRQMGLNSKEWTISLMEPAIPGTTRIVGQKQEEVFQDGQRYLCWDVWTLTIRNGVPQWDCLRPERKKFLLPQV